MKRKFYILFLVFIVMFLLCSLITATLVLRKIKFNDGNLVTGISEDEQKISNEIIATTQENQITKFSNIENNTIDVNSDVIEVNITTNQVTHQEEKAEPNEGTVLVSDNNDSKIQRDNEKDAIKETKNTKLSQNQTDIVENNKEVTEKNNVQEILITENKDKTETQKTEKQDAVKTQTIKKEETKKEEIKKEETKKQSEIKCNGNKHMIEAGNTNKWYSTRDEAIQAFDTEIKKWGDKWTNYEIDSETYYKNCPSGYEIMSCICGKWTIDYIY